MILAADDPRLLLTGHAELLREDGRLVPVRLPRGYADPGLTAAAAVPAGVRLAFDSDATGFEWDATSSAAPFDVVVDGELVLRSRETPLRVSGLVLGRKRFEIWLPQLGHVRLGPLRLPGGAVVAPPAIRPQWTAYGSSITQCTGADGPSETWPALVASANDWTLRCLGFARQCHLDPVVARLIRDTPADLISLCVGTNIHGAASFSARTLAPALTGFVRTIRDGHPDTPLAVLSPPVAPDRERAANAVGLTLADVRAEVESAVRALQKDDPALTLVPGPEIADAAWLADGVHPSADGYRRMAGRLTPVLGGLITC
ncbi:GDSL-type esterase/lipase family protein [Amycolatopsis sp. NBC_00345]|uniref:GDSL-type esterase/lipase family protein n=1 Tax=Amycolatopsis sp. NBC_00345 TaxID=2975955 RepID=UPI002E26C308